MIRRADSKDLNIINNFGSLVIKNFTKTYNLEEYLKDPNYIILVNEYENSINSFLIAYKNYDFYDLEIIFVDEKYRRKGIASELISYLINNYVKEKESIILEVAVNNVSAINLYNKFGFEIINTRKKYYEDIDAYVMKKVK